MHECEYNCKLVQSVYDYGICIKKNYIVNVNLFKNVLKTTSSTLTHVYESV